MHKSHVGAALRGRPKTRALHNAFARHKSHVGAALRGRPKARASHNAFALRTALAGADIIRPQFPSLEGCHACDGVVLHLCIKQRFYAMHKSHVGAALRGRPKTCALHNAFARGTVLSLMPRQAVTLFAPPKRVTRKRRLKGQGDQAPRVPLKNPPDPPCPSRLVHLAKLKA